MKRFQLKTLVAVVAAMAIAAGAYAFTAANTVPASTAGAGSGTVSGYTVSNLHYTLNNSNAANIDSLTFNVDPVIPSSGTGKVVVQASLSTGSANGYSCTTNSNGDVVTCATTSPQLEAEKLTGVTVIAAQ